MYASHNSIDDLFDISLLNHLTVLDLEGNTVSAVQQLKYLRRMPYLQEVNFNGNPITSEFSYYQQIAEVLPRLQILDEEPIGVDLDQFIQRKQVESRRAALPSNDGEQLDRIALKSVLSIFEARLGLTREAILDDE